MSLSERFIGGKLKNIHLILIFVTVYEYIAAEVLWWGLDSGHWRNRGKPASNKGGADKYHRTKHGLEDGSIDRPSRVRPGTSPQDDLRQIALWRREEANGFAFFLLTLQGRVGAAV